MHTSWSEIDTYRQCAFKHHVRYKLEKEPKRTPRSLQIGSMWHVLMELVYDSNDLGAPVDQLKQWRSEGQDPEYVELLTWMLDGYYEKWGVGDPLWTGEVEAIELEFEVELPDIGWGPLNLKGAIDLLVWIDNRLWLVDHKTGAEKPKTQDLELADQWTLYVWAARQLGYEVFGSVHSYAKTRKLKRTMTLEERFERFPIHRTDHECEKVAREATIQAWAAKSENGAPRSPGDHCHFRCDLIDVCIADRRYDERMAHQILDTEFKTRERK